jgi:hypothetical protein
MRFTIGVLLVALLAGTARADMVWHDAYKNPFSSWSAYMYDQNVKRHLRERSTSPSSNAKPRAALSATDFKRDPRRPDVVAQLIATTNLASPEAEQAAAVLRATMAQLAGAGRRDHVATALALTIALAYIVTEKPEFDASKADDLVGGVNEVLAASPQFARLGNTERQAMYDSLLLSAAVIAIVHQSGDKAQAKAIAKHVLAELGL